MVPGERDDQESDTERAVGESNDGRREDEAVTGRAGEGLATPSEGDATDNCRARDDIRTEMEVG